MSLRRSILSTTIVLLPSAAAAQRPAVPAAHVTVRADRFYSEALGAWKDFFVLLPASYGRSPARRYPVAYYLHGLSGSEGDWLARAGIDHVADSLVAGGAPEVILVLPDGDDGWYSDWPAEVPLATCADTLHSESPGKFCVAHQRYDRYVAHDLVSYVDAHYRTRADRAHRGIGGLSMGGYGAIAIALRHPDRFAAAASHSGVLSSLYIGPKPFAAPASYAAGLDTLRALHASFLPRLESAWGSDAAGWRANDPAQLAAALRARHTSLPALFVDCGSEDGLVDENRAFHWELTRLGIPHRYAEWPGAHTWRYWSTHVSESLSWMSGVIGK
ncbi:MAG TPA: alpha/beta hydrolase family protein [Gemmatimonadaceae bacterium]|nr:alpha/beta hydrolase family protein [Gemmatimonadaceae bacterium]